MADPQLLQRTAKEDRDLLNGGPSYAKWTLTGHHRIVIGSSTSQKLKEI